MRMTQLGSRRVWIVWTLGLLLIVVVWMGLLMVVVWTGLLIVVVLMGLLIVVTFCTGLTSTVLTLTFFGGAGVVPVTNHLVIRNLF